MRVSKVTLTKPWKRRQKAIKDNIERILSKAKAILVFDWASGACENGQKQTGYTTQNKDTFLKKPDILRANFQSWHDKTQVMGNNREEDYRYKNVNCLKD